jgi:uncharacterized low-complexity protein
MASRKTALTLALGTAVAASFAVAPIASADENPFKLQSLKNGYQVADNSDKDKEGKCGEGKCGEGKCGGNKDKKKEGACGGDKAKDGACGGDKKKEGSCGGNK